MTTSPMPYTHLGEALATDYLLVREQFSDPEWDRFLATRRFVDEEVLPAINDFWERAELPWPLTTRMAELRVVGEDIEGYGCPGMTPLAVGLVHMELHRGDGSLGTFLGVQSGLAMKSIAMLGSGEQKERWLPTDTIAGLAKLHNTRKAREVIAQARDLLGGNGILLENHVIRHMTDIEVLHTYEGTETMQTLIVGRDITGVGAFV